jgi:predicted enzyme related to lactoylglutathione lyase
MWEHHFVRVRHTMKLNHIHLQVHDLQGAVTWFETIWQVRPGFQNERMATFSFNSLTLIFDAATPETPATIGFESDDCDRDFLPMVERGASVLEPPTNKEWGVRTAYLKGPGALKFEIEGPIV